MTDLTWPPEPICDGTYDGKTYDEIFGLTFFKDAASLMGFELTAANFEQFRQGHLKAFRAYHSGCYEEKNYQTEHAENKALERVAKDAERLMNSLLNLYGFGETQEKLAATIKSNPTSYTHPDGLKLSDVLISGRSEAPLQGIKEFISDLWARCCTHKEVSHRHVRVIHFFGNRRFILARFDLSDAEWRVIAPLLPNKPRGVARVDDRRVLNGIFYILRTGSPWRDLPERYGPYS